MQFLVDAQLPVVLARRLSAAGHPSWHVFDVGLATSNDFEIRRYAISNDLVVVSKDEDFASGEVPHGEQLRVIWIRMGNCGNAHLMEIFMTSFPQILKRLTEGDVLVEVR